MYTQCEKKIYTRKTNVRFINFLQCICFRITIIIKNNISGFVDPTVYRKINKHVLLLFKNKFKNNTYY